MPKKKAATAKAPVFSELSAGELSRRIGAPYATVKYWYRTGVIPTRKLRAVARHTGLPLEDCIPPAA